MKCIGPLVLLLAAEVRPAGPPLGLDIYMPVPELNRLTREKVALGRRLFFDKRLSRDRSIACATCHEPRRAFSDGRAVARGVGGVEGPRNSPAILNRGYGSLFFWDGRAKTLEQQVLEPIFNQKELALTPLELERRTGMKVEQVRSALASYVRSIRSGDSRFDRYGAGKAGALTDIEKAGLAVFRGKANCWMCHTGPNFSDERLHNTGVAFRDGRLVDEGAGKGDFKTPTLREVGRTAPYMHDGSIATLEDVIEFYDKGGRVNANLDTVIQPLELSGSEKAALAAFLRALSGTIREGSFP